MFINQLGRKNSQVLFQQNQQLPESDTEVLVKSEGVRNVSGSPVTENEKILSLEKAILVSQNESLHAQMELVRTRFERELRALREQVMGREDLREENKKLRQRVVFLETVLRRVGLDEADLQPVETCAPVVCPMMRRPHPLPGRPKIEGMPALENSHVPSIPMRASHPQPPNVLPLNSRPQVSTKRSREIDDAYTTTPDINRKRLKQRKNITKKSNTIRQPSIKAQVLDVLRGMKTGGTHVDVKSITTLLTKKQVQRALSELNCSDAAEVVGKRTNEGYIYKVTKAGNHLYVNGTNPIKVASKISSGTGKLGTDMKAGIALQATKDSPTTSLTPAPKELKLRPPSLHKAVKSNEASTAPCSKMSPSTLTMSDKPNP